MGERACEGRGGNSEVPVEAGLPPDARNIMIRSSDPSGEYRAAEEQSGDAGDDVGDAFRPIAAGMQMDSVPGGLADPVTLAPIAIPASR